MRPDWVVVGAGLSGATIAERIATVLNERVLVIDRRPHIAGNAYDERDASGVRVHRYGAHIFHTSSNRVFSYLSRFTTWRPYTHRVLAAVDGHLIPVPFNLTSLQTLVPGKNGRRMRDSLLANIGVGGRVPVLSLLEHDDASLRQLGELVYEKLFLHYTRKQWGLAPEEVDRSVTGRVPVVASTDDRYFTDRYQGIPADGYTAMVRRMLTHRNITVSLATDFRELCSSVNHSRLVFTGAIDELFEYSYGRLPYRSLRFEHSSMPIDRVQDAAVINYPNEFEFTRVIEHAWFSQEHLGVSTITREYPAHHLPGLNEAYYPVPGAQNRAAYRRYRQAATRHGGIVLAGRLARYRYLDMDEAVGLALAVFKTEILESTGQLRGAS